MNDAKAAQRKNVCDSSYDFSLVQHRSDSTGGLLQMLMKHFKFVVQRVSVRTVTTALKVICKSAPSAQKRAAAIYVRRHRDPSVYARAHREL